VEKRIQAGKDRGRKVKRKEEEREHRRGEGMVSRL